jgi:signal transduction histidine kinase
MDTSTQREHELRSPLGTLVTLLDVMSQGFAGEAPPELRDLIERAKRQADRMMEMLAAAHDMERLRWGALAIRPQRVDLGGALRAAMAAVDPAAQVRGVAVEVTQSESGEIPVQADPTLLARCLDTLVRAAVEASTRGGRVALDLAARDGRGVVAARVEAPAKPEALAGAFAQESSLGIRGGTGLGLHEVKLLAEAMGGSAAGAGPALELSLPGA